MNVAIKPYITLLMYTDYFLKYAKGNATGSTIKNVSLAVMNNFLIPLPPLAEQKRIVAKLEELLPIVEQYGKAQTELDELNAALPARLRTSILQEAMQGKLVPNDESEMPFTIFNSQIEARKQGEIKAKRLKKSDAVVKPITEDEIPFEIPSNWTWYRLSDLANMYTGDSINAEQKLKYYTNVKGMEYIATKDVKFNHEVDYSNGVAIPDERRDKFRIAPAGSILLCVEGGSAGRKIATIDRDVCFGNKLCCFATYTDINPFLYYYLQSPMFKDVFRNSITGIIGGVAIKTLRDLLVPLPPLDEQARIVAKIEELFAEIDKLSK
jgi:type I restriction enzyme S subunit